MGPRIISAGPFWHLNHVTIPGSRLYLFRSLNYIIEVVFSNLRNLMGADIVDVICANVSKLSSNNSSPLEVNSTKVMFLPLEGLNSQCKSPSLVSSRMHSSLVKSLELWLESQTFTLPRKTLMEHEYLPLKASMLTPALKFGGFSSVSMMKAFPMKPS
ncbi:hypothetical protein AKJ16_DCAP15721, partial [Drosera capensis]